MLPALTALAVKVTAVPAQTLVVSAVMVTEATATGFTVILILFEVAVPAVTQLRLVVSTQVTASPLFRLSLLKVLEFVPAFEPFTAHWYTGAAPPFMGTAVKLTTLPAQTVVADAKMLTTGVAGVSITTLVLTGGDVQPFTVRVTL